MTLLALLAERQRDSKKTSQLLQKQNCGLFRKGTLLRHAPDDRGALTMITANHAPKSTDHKLPADSPKAPAGSAAAAPDLGGMPFLWSNSDYQPFRWDRVSVVPPA